MGGPRVSIVVTNYNYGRFVGQAIDSVLGQTYPNVEVIVVDDGSTDDSREVITGYGNRIIPILKVNGGEGSAFNAGFAASSGDLVLFLDADDTLHPEALATVAAAWKPGVAKVHFPLETTNAAGVPLGVRNPAEPLPSGDLKPQILRFGFHTTPPNSAIAFSRTVLEQLMPIPEATWRLYADYYLIALAALLGPVVALDTCLGSYRVHDKNVSWNTGNASGLQLERLRREMTYEIARVEAIQQFSRDHDIAVRPDMVWRNPGHAKNRLLSLRLDPAGHPWPGDVPSRLLMLGIKAAWTFPQFGLVQRIKTTAGMLLAFALPKGWLLPFSEGRLRRFHGTGSAQTVGD